jgi:hypothetical protein
MMLGMGRAVPADTSACTNINDRDLEYLCKTHPRKRTSLAAAWYKKHHH